MYDKNKFEVIETKPLVKIKIKEGDFKDLVVVFTFFKFENINKKPHLQFGIDFFDIPDTLKEKVSDKLSHPLIEMICRNFILDLFKMTDIRTLMGKVEQTPSILKEETTTDVNREPNS